MGKLSHAQGRELVENGIITEEALQRMIEEGKVGAARGSRSSGPKRVFSETEVTPVLYFKNSKGVEPTDDMKACRAEVAEVFKKYTVLAE